MKISASPTDWQSQLKANELVNRLDERTAYLKERFPVRDGVIEDSYNRTGCGRGFAMETQRGFFKLSLDPKTGQTGSYQARHEHIENGHSDERVQVQTRPDGGKTYERKYWFDGGGQITSHTETVKLGVDGKREYEFKPDNSVKFTNWVRRNRSLQTLTGLVVGGGLGALGGHALLGPTGAVLGGLLAANVVDFVVRTEQEVNHRSHPSNLERKIWRPVEQLRIGTQVGGALAGFGLLMALTLGGH
ncbi:hypothetical protein JST97_32960 [bacterium]|nr:hypothetical protein [bacterium]